MGKGTGDRLASGRAQSAQFATGGAKVKDKVILAPGIMASEETRKALDTGKQAVAQAKPRLKSRLIPLYDRVIIRRDDEAAVTQGGIFIPDEVRDRPMQGTVLYVGFGRVLPDGTLQALRLNPGDTVLYGKYAGTEVKVDDEIVLMMREEEVLAIVEGK
jgi:chaperonin GroES